MACQEYHAGMVEIVPRRVRLRLRLVASSVLMVVGLLAGLTPSAALAQADIDPPAAWTWERSEVPIAPAGIELWDVTAGGPGFIAVGGGFTEGAQVATAVIWVSDDGRVWQSVPLFGEAASGVPRAIAATADGYVAVGSGCCPDEAAVWLSPDGLSWQRLADEPGFAGTAMLGVTATPDGVVAVGCSAVMECMGGLAWTSPDGLAWSEPVILDMLPLGAASTSAGVLALGSSQPYEGDAALSTSDDGVTWTATTDLAVGGSLHAAVDMADGVLAVGGMIDLERGDSEGLLATSSDALSWEAQQSRRLRGVWLEDVAATDAGLLLIGWRASRGGQVPATLWTTDLSVFEPGAFPREVKMSGALHGVALGEDGATAVAVGWTILNRGQAPTIWVSSG